MWLYFLACVELTPSDCLPTTGDNCSCEPQCMTEREIRRAQSGGVCDLSCDFSEDTGWSSSPNWTCTVVDGECAVVQ